LRLVGKPGPWDSVQVDVTVVKISGQQAFQYTALDEALRVCVLCLYRRLTQRSSLVVPGEPRRACPVVIRRSGRLPRRCPIQKEIKQAGWGLVRRNRRLGRQKLRRLSKRRHAGGCLEDWS
jgi:hypothetical protein